MQSVCRKGYSALRRCQNKWYIVEVEWKTTGGGGTG